jgi:hypothetical protein
LCCGSGCRDAVRRDDEIDPLVAGVQGALALELRGCIGYASDRIITLKRLRRIVPSYAIERITVG